MKNKVKPESKTLTCKLRPYKFDLSKPNDWDSYLGMIAEIRTITGKPKPMPGLVLANQGHPRELLDNGVLELELETSWLSDHHQWNTAPGHGSTKGWRVFDWAENIYDNKQIKHGYYLEITNEMREILRNTSACGYCGFQTPSARGLVFCDQCLGSPYLEEKDLHLLRMVPLSRPFKENRELLTEAERAHLMPQYVEAQTVGKTEADKKRIKQERERIEKDYKEACTNAKNEYDGKLYLHERGFKLDNVIYYNHTGRFCFGWRTPLNKETFDRLNEMLSEFPAPYDIKTIFDGVKSSG